MSPPGHPVATHPGGASAADSPHLPALIAGVEATAVLADEGYDADSNRGAIRAAGAEPCLPPRRNRAAAVEYDRHLYKERSRVERFLGRVKRWRRVATRYGKGARNFLGFVWLAAIDLTLA